MLLVSTTKRLEKSKQLLIACCLLFLSVNLIVLEDRGYLSLGLSGIGVPVSRR